MEARYIIKALEAMKQAQTALIQAPGNEAWIAYMQLNEARAELFAYSGVGRIEIPVEEVTE